MNLTYEFSHPVERIWRMLSDSELINKLMGTPPVSYETKPDPVGGSKRFGNYQIFGNQISWFEAPYEWVENEYYSLMINYSTGPLLYAKSILRLEPSDQGCRAHLTVRFKIRNALSVPTILLGLCILTKRRIIRSYSKVNSLRLEELDLNSKTAEKLLLGTKFVPTKRIRRTLSERLFQAEVPAELHPKFEDLIFNSPDSQLNRIQPFRIAREWGMPRDRILETFLKTTRSGVFDLSWDLLCPNCRGAKVRIPSLQQLKEKAHCPQCNIYFNSDFDQSLELTFIVHPAIRAVKYLEYCTGNPQDSENFLAQLCVQPQERKTIALHLSEPSYELRSLQWGGRYRITVTNSSDAKSQVTLTIQQENPKQETLHLKSGRIECTLENLLPHNVTLTIERSGWVEEVCTAAYALNFQTFRDLFCFEVIQPGVEFKIASVVILFTDITDSTLLYHTVGDAKAFAMINTHFSLITDCVRECHGAVVKTIGDSVMASFLRPEDAIQAAIAIQKNSSQLQVKIGIHFGPCFVVNHANRLDYFGTTVNMSARTLQECQGSQILITSQMMEDPGVKVTLLKEKLLATQIVRSLRGLPAEFELYEVTAR